MPTSSLATGSPIRLPDKQQAVAASGRLDAKLTGANAIDVLIEFPKGTSLYAPDTLQTIADVHSAGGETGRRRQRMVAGNAAAGGWRKRPEVPTFATLKEYVNLISRIFGAAFHFRRSGSVVVSGRVPDLDSSEILPVVRKARSSPGYGAQGASRL